MTKENLRETQGNLNAIKGYVEEARTPNQLVEVREIIQQTFADPEMRELLNSSPLSSDGNALAAPVDSMGSLLNDLDTLIVTDDNDVPAPAASESAEYRVDATSEADLSENPEEIIFDSSEDSIEESSYIIDEGSETEEVSVEERKVEGQAVSYDDVFEDDFEIISGPNGHNLTTVYEENEEAVAAWFADELNKITTAENVNETIEDFFKQPGFADQGVITLLKTQVETKFDNAMNKMSEGRFNAYKKTLDKAKEFAEDNGLEFVQSSQKEGVNAHVAHIMSDPDAAKEAYSQPVEALQGQDNNMPDAPQYTNPKDAQQAGQQAQQENASADVLHPEEQTKQTKAEKIKEIILKILEKIKEFLKAMAKGIEKGVDAKNDLYRQGFKEITDGISKLAEKVQYASLNRSLERVREINPLSIEDTELSKAVNDMINKTSKDITPDNIEERTDDIKTVLANLKKNDADNQIKSTISKLDKLMSKLEKMANAAAEKGKAQATGRAAALSEASEISFEESVELSAADPNDKPSTGMDANNAEKEQNRANTAEQGDSISK